MLRTAVFCAVVAATAAGATLVGAPASAAGPEDFKVAYVDMARALNEVEDGKSAKSKLEKEFGDKQKQIDKMKNDLKEKTDAFEKRKGMMKPEARETEQEELQKEYLKWQQTAMQLQQELLASQQQVTNDIAGKLRNVIAKIGDRDAYTLVLDIGESVLYYKRHRDLTEEVVKEYNKQYGKK